MTSTISAWTPAAGISQSWPLRRRRTPVESSATDRERHRLRHENRRAMQEAAYRLAYEQFWARR